MVERIHSWLLENDRKLSATTGTALLKMYLKCGSVERAEKVFQEMTHRNVKTWTILIAALGERGSIEEAMVAFRAMQLDGIQPNSFTLVAIFQACATRLESREDDRVKALCNQAVESGLLASSSWNVIVATAVIGTYGKCGSVDKALEVFERTPRESRDVVAWNSIITVFVEQNKPELALKLFQEMQLEGEEPTRITLLKVLAAATASRDLGVGRLIHREARFRSMDRDLVVGTALASMYSKLGRVEELLEVMERIEQGGRDLVCWNMIISALVQHSRSKEALAYFREMNLQGVKPDRVTLAPLISSATFPENESKVILCEISRSGLSSNAGISNAILNFHAKGRRLEEARRVFDGIQERDLVSWNSMISAYAAEGFAREAVILFHRMKQEGFQPNGSSPDTLTFTTILSLYSHAGLLEDGCHCFGSISRDHFLAPAPQHYNCVIDLLGRAGRIEDAEGFVRGMPCATSAPAWTALLSACKTQGDVDRGKRIADGVAECSTAYIGLISSEEP
ncbi:hypothetical protein SELMODRAFT_114405 [Selaginella moellendorffii]|uniref:Pentacotripeptide-repeat region of PRORP domain-containing protein n=1 Tax=Selaginella moellendorffii TaxID=88036 RepID=D8SDJ0_SELML|nr:hypothetical protein SELMODRAFT_114405 [Selaginella moellendorffii]